MTTTNDLPDVVIERYRVQELPASEMARIASRMQRDDVLRARIEALDESDTELEPDVERIASRLENEPLRASSRAAWRTTPIALIGVVAVAMAVVRLRTPVERAPEDRVKGAPAARVPTIAVYRRTPNGSERLGDGATARAGDVIRLGYSAAGHRFGAIVSIDGRGTVTRHLPTTGDRAIPLDGSASVLLDSAYELDDAPMWERFYLVAGETPFEIAPVVQALQRGAPPPPGLTRSIVTIRKEGSR